MKVSWSDVLIRSRSLRPLISTEFSPSMAATFRFASPSTLEASNAKSKSESASKFRDDPLLTEPSTASTPEAADCWFALKLALESSEKLELSTDTLMSEVSVNAASLSLLRTPLRAESSSSVSSEFAVPSTDEAKRFKSASILPSRVISPSASSWSTEKPSTLPALVLAIASPVKELASLLLVRPRFARSSASPSISIVSECRPRRAESWERLSAVPSTLLASPINDANASPIRFVSPELNSVVIARASCSPSSEIAWASPAIVAANCWRVVDAEASKLMVLPAVDSASTPYT